MAEKDYTLSVEHDLQITGIILADSGPDMSTDSAGQAHSEYEEIIQRQVGIMEVICAEVIVVTSKPRLFLPIVNRSVRIITNLFPDKGWFGGMYSALYLSKNDDLWIVDSQMPHISPLAAQILLTHKKVKDSQAAIPFIEGRAYPLHGVYDKSCAESVSVLVSRANSSIHDLLDVINVLRIEEEAFRSRGIDLRFVRSSRPINPLSIENK